MSPRRILVWDVPTRLFHWLLAISFVGGLATGDSERYRDLHVLFGATMLVLIVFRLAWGVVGTRYARFGSFAFGPRALLRYLTSLATLRSTRYVGHTPGGSWAIWAMLVLGILVGITGYAAYADAGGEWVEELHGALAWALLGVVVVHVLGVLLSSALHRENLIAAMITGRKHGAPSEAIRHSRWVVAAGLAALVLALWVGIVSVPGVGIGGAERPAARADRGGVAAHED
jgi:cytochrome b